MLLNRCRHVGRVLITGVPDLRFLLETAVELRFHVSALVNGFGGSLAFWRNRPELGSLCLVFSSAPVQVLTLKRRTSPCLPTTPDVFAPGGRCPGRTRERMNTFAAQVLGRLPEKPARGGWTYGCRVLEIRWNTGWRGASAANPSSVESGVTSKYARVMGTSRRYCRRTGTLSSGANSATRRVSR